MRVLPQDSSRDRGDRRTAVEAETAVRVVFDMDGQQRVTRLCGVQSRLHLIVWQTDIEFHRHHKMHGFRSI
jgi:hypothetical protein